MEKQYEELLNKLELKQRRLDYLASFFSSTAQKITAVKAKIDDHERQIEAAEARSTNVDALKLFFQFSFVQSTRLRSTSKVSVKEL